MMHGLSRAIFLLLSTWVTSRAANASNATNHWDYSKASIGKWPGVACHDGTAQSPINLELNTAVDSQHKAIEINEAGRNKISKEDAATLKVINNGHTVKIHGAFLEKVEVSGGGLQGKYRAAQFHMHWGTNNNEGSEHQLDGRKFPLELHLVTYSAKYANATKAVESKEKDALAVLGVWYQVSDDDDDSVFAKLVNATFKTGKMLHDTEQGFDSAPDFAVRDLLPPNLKRFYRYEGSLTTPGCNEIVTWTVFEEPKKMKESDIELLRQVAGAGDAKIGPNYRPVQKLGKRKMTRNSAGGLCGGTLVLTAVIATIAHLKLWLWV